MTGVIVSKNSGRLIDGHARIEEALSQDAERLIPFTEVDLSEDEERLILAVLDPLGSLAQTDAERLSELVASIDLDSENLLAVFQGMINLPEEIAPTEHGDG